jgi:hypothetical protein
MGNAESTRFQSRNDGSWKIQPRGASCGITWWETLNPMWVEWLMGWPLGWTDLKPLETDKFQKWLDEHGGRYELPNC